MVISMLTLLSGKIMGCNMPLNYTTKFRPSLYKNFRQMGNFTYKGNRNEKKLAV
jgi:hypothetical protein